MNNRGLIYWRTFQAAEWRRILLAMSICLLTAAVGLHLLTSSDESIYRAKFDRIQNGMTEAEAEAVLGQPVKGWIGSKSIIGKAWISDEGLVEVYFGRANGRVVSKEFAPFPRQSIFQKIVTWISAGY